jgi:hypothetical protein
LICLLDDFDVQRAVAKAIAQQAALKGKRLFSELLVKPLEPPYELTLEDVRGTSLESEFPL